MAENENIYKVRLQNAQRRNERVSFEATPTIVETRNVNYNALEPLHAPGQIQVYKNTTSRTYNISDIRLLSRTMEEAEINLRNLWILRGWTMPRFGRSTTLTRTQARNRTTYDSAVREGATSDELFYDEQDRRNILGTELLGSPPAVLLFSAYSRPVGTDSERSKRQHINRVPVVISQMSLPYPNDVDYIPTTSGVPMPTIMTLDLVLTETHSPNGYERFNLSAFKQGRLQGY